MPIVGKLVMIFFKFLKGIQAVLDPQAHLKANAIWLQVLDLLEFRIEWYDRDSAALSDQ